MCWIFETFFTNEKDSRGVEYRLKRHNENACTTEEYIRHPWFEAHGAAIKWDKNAPARWYNEDQLRYVLSQEDWSDTCLISHHAHFDGFILAHHYGVVPKMYGCTLSMARLLLGNHISVSLDSVRSQFGLPAKFTPYNFFKGKHWRELDREVQEIIAGGCCDEVESIWRLFGILAKDFPPEEYLVVDQIVRMFVNPVLRADTGLLAKIWEKEEKDKHARRTALNLTSTDLASNDRFAALLRDAGVEPEKKLGPPRKDGTRGEIYAFAKTDPQMEELLDHEDPYVRELAEARIGEKSTILQTRAATLGWMASRGPLPVYLRYCGASTLRPSGGDGANWLNLKRGSVIRPAIMAPEGYLLGPIDASQIEFRVAMYLAEQEDVLDLLRRGGDPYVSLASEIYGEKIYKPAKDDPRKLEMEQKRGAGKQGRLMCLGPDTLILTDSGVKPITSVKLSDKLWDGVEWVAHQGLISQGVKRVVRRKGVFMTPDHLISCGNTWQPASILKGNILLQALATGSESLPYPVMNLLQKAGSSLLSSSALAALRSILSSLKICSWDAVRVVMLALRSKADSGIRLIEAMPTLVPNSGIGGDCSDASAPYTRVADASKLRHFLITEDAAFRFTRLGKRIGKRFLLTWSHCQGGIIRRWKLIESTIKAATCPVIFASQIARFRLVIDGVLEISKMKLPTYDIVCAGPRNRFTIVSNAGPLIVHNCIYGAAAKQYQHTLRVGLYGPPVRITLIEAERHVYIARNMMPKVTNRNTGYWTQCERIIARLAGGPPMEWGPFTVKDRRLILPSGHAMIYDTLEFYKPASDEDCRDFERSGYWRMKTRNGWKKMWGSKLTQNIMEMVSRVIVSQAMIRIWEKYGIRTLNWPYDELLLLIKDDSKAEETLELCRLELCREPAWLPGLPLGAEASLGKRYSK